jgi:hypothetical protein
VGKTIKEGEWRVKAKAAAPVRYFLKETLPLEIRRAWNRFAHEPWYWLKCAAWHRHNVLVMRDLPPTWTDRDDRLLHSCFQLLKDFVEREDRGGNPKYIGHTQKTRDELVADYDFTYEGIDQELAKGIREEAERCADAWMEVRDLYDWWEMRRKDGDEFQCDEQYGKDNEMLKRLVAVRMYLWS